MRIGVARSGTKKSNLKERTVRSPSVLLLESRAPSGGVVEAGLGGDQHPAGDVQYDGGLGQAGVTDQEVNWRNDCEFDVYFIFLIFKIFQPVHNVILLHHLDRAHPSEVAGQLRGHARVEGSASSRSRSSLELEMWGHDGVKRRL